MQIPIWFWCAMIAAGAVAGAMFGLTIAPTHWRREAKINAASAGALYVGIIDALIQLRQQNDPTAAAARLQAALDKERFRK